MIPFAEAHQIVMQAARLLGAEHVAMDESLGRILAEDVVSDIDMPPFNKSAMDGYACRRDDLAGDLQVLETIQAGTVPRCTVGPGQCAKIMTGAMVPEGADCVVMVEHTEELPAGRIRCTRSQARANICYVAEDLHAGDVVLLRGAAITPSCVAVLATVGRVRPLVARQPRVGIIGTGDELVEPDHKPGPSQIRNSNSFQLFAQVLDAGGDPTYFGIAPDTRDGTDRIVKAALADSDVLLLSGGVSVGDFDVVPEVLEQNGFRLQFRGIAMKPGKPTHFGVSEHACCFGLPGNPVSTFIQFELLIRPFLQALMGHQLRPRISQLPLATEISRKRTDRESWLPVAITDEGTIRLLDYHGSAHINALSHADGLIVVPTGMSIIEQGASVRVRHI